jgi:hypothetical protein
MPAGRERRILEGARDFVFRNQESLKRGTLTPDKVAKAVGVDSAALKERMGSAEIDAVLQRDINEAKLLELKETPAIYVEGRHVDSLVAMDARFWQQIADWYWKRAGLPRPKVDESPASGSARLP